MSDLLTEPIVRHAVDLRFEPESIQALCDERIPPEQLGAWFSPDPEAWKLFLAVAVMCPACLAAIKSRLGGEE